jgi:hypothetical protein
MSFSFFKLEMRFDIKKDSFILTHLKIVNLAVEVSTLKGIVSRDGLSTETIGA